MTQSRPDLTNLDPEIVAYIETLEAKISQLQASAAPARIEPAAFSETEPPEPPTTINLISATPSGLAKRTPRHHYARQRRGGMGIFDIEVPADQAPGILALADESATLLAITDQARAFRLPARSIPETEVRARGSMITSRFDLNDDEHIAALLPIQSEGYLAVASRWGKVRLLRHHIFGEYMKAGTALYDLKTFGPFAAACWTPGDGDLFTATRTGRAIRFSEKLVPPAGTLAIRLSEADEVVAITAVYADRGVFLLSADGKGTIRQMEGFAPNKAPGAGGKAAMLTDNLIGAVSVETDADLFIISRLGKIIRFRAAEVPAKTGVVQGVNCMAYRADEAAAICLSPAPSGV